MLKCKFVVKLFSKPNSNLGKYDKGIWNICVCLATFLSPIAGL